MSQELSTSLQVPLEALVALAVEHWRLSNWLAQQNGHDTAAARHAVGRLGDFLSAFELEARSLDGQVADAGLAARVVEAVDDPSMPAGSARIEETLSPLILWQGKVIKEAQVVTRRGAAT